MGFLPTDDVRVAFATKLAFFIRERRSRHASIVQFPYSSLHTRTRVPDDAVLRLFRGAESAARVRRLRRLELGVVDLAVARRVSRFVPPPLSVVSRRRSTASSLRRSRARRAPRREVLAQRAQQPSGLVRVAMSARRRFPRARAPHALAAHVPVRARALARDAVHTYFAVRARAALRALPG